MPAPTVVDQFGAVNTVTSTTAVVTVPRAVSAGSSLILFIAHTDAAGSLDGITSVVDSKGNTWVLHDAQGVRANTVAVDSAHAHLTTPLAVNDTITVTIRSAQARKAVEVLVATGLDTTKTHEASSATTVTDNTNSGANGSGTALTATTSAANTTTTSLVVAGFGSGVQNFSAGSGFTLAATQATAAGSADRQLAVIWKAVTASAVQTATGTLGASSSWTGAVATFPGFPPPSLTHTEVHLWEVDSNTDAGATVTLTQTSGPTATITGPDGSGVFRVTPPTPQNTDIVLQLTATGTGGSTSRTVTLPAVVVAPSPTTFRRVRVAGTYVAS